MNKLSLIALMLFSMNSFAMECPFQIGTEEYQDQVTALIRNESSCDSASEIYTACAAGSSMDTSFAAAALKICTKRINRADTTVKEAVKAANELCEKKFARSSGSIAQSAQSSCVLEVAKLYDYLLSPARL